MCENTYVNIQTGKVLNMERVASLKDNAMLRHSHHLFEEWDFEKNDKLGLDVYKVTKGSHKKAWWYCEKCEDSYPQSIGKKFIGRGCSICKGYFCTPKNSFGGKFPNLLNEWNAEKNINISPFEFSYGSGVKVWWICNKGHEWEATFHNRGNGTNCPYCVHNPKVLDNYNDLWTTHPSIAELLVDKSIGFTNTFGSNLKVEWKCTDCSSINVNTINELVNKRKCKKCGDNISMGEKIVYSLLENKNLEFQYDNTLSWSKGKRYDFILNINGKLTIIEIHGIQHYEESPRGKRSLKEEQENDKYKYDLAMKNGVENYIIIDAKYS